MAAIDTARLIASLELKDLFSPKVSQIDKSLSKLNAGIDKTGSRSFRAGQQIGTGIKTGAVIAAGAVGLLAANVGKGLESLSKLDDVVAQTNAVLKSTKGAAGENAQAIRDLANKYENLNATIDDTVIQSGENLLLTFTNIRKQAFEPTLQAALDMNQALGGGEAGLQGTIQRLGKALNDPVKGLTALQRVGVTFTAEQKDQIKTAVEAGDTFKAQGIILAELNKRFGGSFLAGGQTTAGKVAKFKDAIDDLQRTLATALLPAVGKVSDALSKFLSDPKVTAAVERLGQNIAGLFSDANLAKGADFLKTMFQTAQAAAPILEGAAKATLGFVQAAVAVFKQLPAPLQGALVGGFALNKLTGGLVTNIGGALLDLVGKSRGASPANPVFVADVTGGAGGVAGAAGKGVLGKLGNLASKVFIVGETIGLVAAIGNVVTDIRTQSAEQGKTIATSVANQINGGASLADLQKSLAAVDEGIIEITKGGPLTVLLAGDALDTLKAQHKLLDDQITLLKSGGVKVSNVIGADNGPSNANVREDRVGAFTSLAGKIKDDLQGPANILKGAVAEFSAATKQLAHPKSQTELVHAFEEVTKLLRSGRGGAEVTAHRIDLLRKQLSNVHDPKTRAALEAQLRKVEGLLPGRQFAAKELAKADSILKSNESTTRKIVGLQEIERALKDRGLPHAADRIRAKEDEVKRATTAAGRNTADAIRRKRLSVTVNNPVTVQTYVSTRTVETTIRKINRFGITVT